MAKRRPKRDLRPYQRSMARIISRWREVLLAADMGTGKTAACLTAAEYLLAAGEIRRVLVIAPLLVARETWPDEMDAWEHLAHLDYAICVGSIAERRAAIKRRATFTFVNRENFVWFSKQFAGVPWPFDMVIWDESSSLAAWKRTTDGTKLNPRKQLTRFGALCKIQKFVSCMVLLSGTPASRGLIDLGGQIYVLDGGERLGDNISSYRNRWFESDYMGWKWTPKDYAEREITSRVKDIMVTLKAEDYLDLPPTKFNDIIVRMDKRTMAEYRQFERDLISEAYDVEAVSSGVLTGKLLQFANGGLYRDLGRDARGRRMRETVSIHDLKLDALASIIEESAGESVLVAYSFQFDVERILKRFGKKVRLIGEEKNGIKDWNRGRVHVGLVHPASIGHGTNLQFGGHIAAWFGLTWSLELYLQFNKRLPRPGQGADFVTIHRILTRGTVDMDLVETLHERNVTQDRITDTVRQRFLDLE